MNLYMFLLIVKQAIESESPQPSDVDQKEKDKA